MKLITEFYDQTTTLVEETDGKKNLYIEGIFMQAEKKNRNGRIYPEKVLDREARKLQEKIAQHRALGELNHPTRYHVDPKYASHRIVELNKVGTDWVGKALILNTPEGNIVKGLLEGGTQIGVSTRGVGSLKESNGVNIVQEDFDLSTVDIVSDPSAPDAFVNGIMEGVEWVWENGLLVEKVVSEIKKDIEKTPAKRLTEEKIKAFEKFMKAIKSQVI